MCSGNHRVAASVRHKLANAVSCSESDSVRAATLVVNCVHARQRVPPPWNTGDGATAITMRLGVEPTYLFLDCEWADVLGAELVSLALVSADGRQRFYAERDPLPESPTDFVRIAVYPLLDRGSAALSDAEFTAELRGFLRGVERPYVLFDYHNDGALLRYALAGFDLPDSEAVACGPIPSPVLTEMLRQGLISVLLEDWFQAHPEASARRHHAAVDAEALRQAWLAATGRTQEAWAQGTLQR